MAEVANNFQGVDKGPRKRNIGKTKSSKKNKKLKMMQGTREKFKVTKKMQKLFSKRARDYNSDDGEEEEEEEEQELALMPRDEVSEDMEMGGDVSSEEGEERENLEADNENSEGEEDDQVQLGTIKFTEGCRAFKMAFKNIVTKKVSDDSLGPVLSGHKQLIAKKLAEEETEKKAKGEAKKEKHLIAEKGHVKPPNNYLDSNEKFLISVATKGVVKLFNAVSKAQNAQKGLDPSRSKDAKVLRKRRKEAFFSELGKIPSQAPNSAANKGTTSNAEAPAWAPLRDNFMLTNPKLKDWDKMPDQTLTDDIQDSGSDDD